MHLPVACLKVNYGLLRGAEDYTWQPASTPLPDGRGRPLAGLHLPAGSRTRRGRRRPPTGSSGLTRRPSPHPRPSAYTAPAVVPARTAEQGAASTATRLVTGLFSKKRALDEENAGLRDQLARLGALDAAQIQAHTEQVRAALTDVQQQLAQTQLALAAARADVVQTEEIALLQEAGVYAYAHPLESAVAYKEALAKLRADVKATVSAGNAVLASTSWNVNGSAAQGRIMVSDFSKLLLRAYNAEADNCVRTVKPHAREAAIERLSKAATTIARLGKTMNIRIAEPYHQLRCWEIRMTADYSLGSRPRRRHSGLSGSGCARSRLLSATSSAKRPG